MAYKLWHPIQYSKEPNHPLGSKNVDFTISPLLGVRWIDVEQNLSRNGGKSDTGYGQWAAAYIGLRGKLSIELPENTPFLKIIELTAECGAGATFGSELGTVAQVRANLNLYLTEQVAVSPWLPLFRGRLLSRRFSVQGPFGRPLPWYQG